MPMDQSQLNKVQSWCSSKGVTNTCPMCSHYAGGWSVGEIIAAPTLVGGGVNMGQVIPMVPVTCTNCAFVRLFAAMTIGLT
jgi:hypothetical protein